MTPETVIVDVHFNPEEITDNLLVAGSESILYFHTLAINPLNV